MKGITSVVGMIISFAAIVAGIIILGGDINNFVNVPSILLTVVPTIGALVATYPLSFLKKVPSHFKVILGGGYQPGEFVEAVSNFARRARIEGLLSLQNAQISDPSMQYCLTMIADGIDESEIRHFIEDSLAGLNDRHNEAISFYEKGAAYAPAFGMCATVISLINMLMGLDFSDAAAINKLGGNMSAALITTFYGSVLANVVFLPLAGWMRYLHKREIFCKTIIYNGVLGIQRGDNPTYISDSMREQLAKYEK